MKSSFQKKCYSIKNRKLLCAFIINIFFFVLVLLFCDIKYETSDDFVIASILSGAYGNEVNQRMIYINPLIGYILTPLYNIWPQISWLFIYQLSSIFISSTTVCYVFFKRTSIAIAAMLSLMLILFFSNDAYILMQYTKTAMLSTISGGILFIWALKNQNLISITAGMLMCINGILIRYSVIFIAAGFLIFIFVKELIHLFKYKKQLLKVGIFAFILSILAINVKVFDYYLYQTEDQYKFYYDFNKARTQIVDYTDYGYETYAKELEEIGVSENDYYMLKTWNFADSDYFTLKKMQQVAEIIQSHYKSHKITFEKTLEDFQTREIWGYPICIICVILLFLEVVLNKKEWKTMIYSFFIGIAYLIYFLAIRERCIYRIEYCVFLGVFITGAYFWRHEERNEKFYNECYYKIILILCLTNLILYVPDFTYKDVTSKNRKEYVESVFDASWDFGAKKYRKVVGKDIPQNGLIEEMINNKQNFYFLDFGTTIQTLYFDTSPWQALPKNYYENFMYLSGITSNFPDTIEVLNKYGLDNPLKNLVNDNVYLVDNENLGIKLNYIREHYYSDAQAYLYKEIDGYQIWKLYTNEF